MGNVHFSGKGDGVRTGTDNVSANQLDKHSGSECPVSMRFQENKHLGTPLFSLRSGTELWAFGLRYALHWPLFIFCFEAGPYSSLNWSTWAHTFDPPASATRVQRWQADAPALTSLLQSVSFPPAASQAPGEPGGFVLLPCTVLCLLGFSVPVATSPLLLCSSPCVLFQDLDPRSLRGWILLLLSSHSF